MLVTETTSPEEALNLIKNNKFDAAILDMNMPEMDGIMLAREIRKIYPKTVIPLLMLTSLDTDKSSLEELNNIFSAYLFKPVKYSHLFKTLVNMLFENSNITMAATGNTVTIINEAKEN